jgi:hypothetical protein
MGCPFKSAWMLGPCAVAGSVKFIASPKMTGYNSRTISLRIVRITSASTKNVAGPDQLSTETVTFRAGYDGLDGSIFVKGHGPAMQDTLTF